MLQVHLPEGLIMAEILQTGVMIEEGCHEVAEAETILLQLPEDGDCMQTDGEVKYQVCINALWQACGK